jgi:hypothetical protein
MFFCRFQAECFIGVARGRDFSKLKFSFGVKRHAMANEVSHLKFEVARNLHC